MKKLMKYARIIMAVVMIVTVFAACNNSTTATGDEKPTIGVSLFYRRDEYYKDLDAAFEKEATAAGFNIIIQDADADPAKQVQQLEDFVQQKVDAIALAAADPAGLVPAIDAAVAAGVPVVTYDGDANTETRKTFVGFDYYDDGVMVGDWTVEYINSQLGGNAKVAVIDFPQSAIVCAQRADGFQDVVTKLPGVEVVARQDGKATRSDSMTVMENILTANPDVQIVFGINFDTCAGAKAAIESAGRTDIIVVGTGYGKECFEALENNDPILKAFAVSSPQIQAKDTVAAIKKILAGEEVPSATLSSSILYDSESIKDYDWEAIIAERNK